MNNRVTVSVLMITYNHEKYISQAIDSALMQKTNFDYEIVIGEDCSTDKTREIVLEYKAKYPDKIKLILQEKNVGPAQNWIDTYRACIGKYIALLEGDDYWTDPYKLQKQVDILEAHPDYSMCFHNALVNDFTINSSYPFNEEIGTYFRKKLYKNRNVEAWEFIYQWICPTASVLFRNNLNDNLIEVIRKTQLGDIILFLFLLKQGKAFYINKTFSVYNKLPTGKRNSYENDILGLINHYKVINNHFNDLKFVDFICSVKIFSFNVILLKKILFKKVNINKISLLKDIHHYFKKIIFLEAPFSKVILFLSIFKGFFKLKKFN